MIGCDEDGLTGRFEALVVWVVGTGLLSSVPRSLQFDSAYVP